MSYEALRVGLVANILFILTISFCPKLILSPIFIIKMAGDCKGGQGTLGDLLFVYGGWTFFTINLVSLDDFICQLVIYNPNYYSLPNIYYKNGFPARSSPSVACA